MMAGAVYSASLAARRRGSEISSEVGVWDVGVLPEGFFIRSTDRVLSWRRFR